jgi:hypothetical protein
MYVRLADKCRWGAGRGRRRKRKKEEACIDFSLWSAGEDGDTLLGVVLDFYSLDYPTG